tara:strand:- start:890 stop:1615 length:726 start_codon:yes stop_codon:yes gene_type:complete
MAKKKPGRKPKKKLYFGPEVQDAIIRYNTNSENYNLRNKIYQKEIHAAFDKLAENIINTFKFTYFDYPFEDVKAEVVSFLVMNMHKYDHTKGSKAFSYFSIVAKNYLILHNNNNYKKMKIHDNIDVVRNVSNPSTDSEELANELLKDVITYFDKNILTIFNKKRDIDVAYAIIELFKSKDEIENFNKKALYILIREMTNVNTIHITSVVNIFKKHYRKIIEQHYKNTTNKSKIPPITNKFF